MLTGQKQVHWREGLIMEGSPSGDHPSPSMERGAPTQSAIKEVAVEPQLQDIFEEFGIYNYDTVTELRPWSALEEFDIYEVNDRVREMISDDLLTEIASISEAIRASEASEVLVHALRENTKKILKELMSDQNDEVRFEAAMEYQEAHRKSGARAARWAVRNAWLRGLHDVEGFPSCNRQQLSQYLDRDKIKTAWQKIENMKERYHLWVQSQALSLRTESMEGLSVAAGGLVEELFENVKNNCVSWLGNCRDYDPKASVALLKARLDRFNDLLGLVDLTEVSKEFNKIVSQKYNTEDCDQVAGSIRKVVASMEDVCYERLVKFLGRAESHAFEPGELVHMRKLLEQLTVVLEEMVDSGEYSSMSRSIIKKSKETILEICQNLRLVNNESTGLTAEQAVVQIDRCLKNTAALMQVVNGIGALSAQNKAELGAIEGLQQWAGTACAMLVMPGSPLVMESVLENLNKDLQGLRAIQHLAAEIRDLRVQGENRAELGAIERLQQRTMAVWDRLAKGDTSSTIASVAENLNKDLQGLRAIQRLAEVGTAYHKGERQWMNATAKHRQRVDGIINTAFASFAQGSVSVEAVVTKAITDIRFIGAQARAETERAHNSYSLAAVFGRSASSSPVAEDIILAVRDVSPVNA